MRTLLILLLFTSTFAQEDDGSVTECDSVTLVKCFINILDEWAWTLYDLHKNVVTISNEQCDHLRELEKCISDNLTIRHKCTHNEVVTISNTVSDLLTHRKDSGSFLRSYYLLKYPCTQEGQEILTKHRDCLKNEKIGEMTLSAGTYLSEKFLKDQHDDVCGKVNGKLQEYIGLMKSTSCSEREAARLMCNSLINMFRGLHADELENCTFDCNLEQLEAEQEEEAKYVLQTDAVNEPVQQATEHDALGPQTTGSAIACILPLLTLVPFRIL